MKTDNPELAAFFPTNSNPLDMFKFVKFPTVFPIPYGATAIKWPLSDDSIGDALRHISETTGPLWVRLIAEWSNPLAD